MGTRRRSATQDDMAGFIAAATRATSVPSGNLDGAALIDESLVGHGADDIVDRGEVHGAPVGSPADAVDAGNHRQGAAAGVVSARGAGAHPRM
jgi:hypothetical protein